MNPVNRRSLIRSNSFNAATFARSVLRWTPDPKQELILQSGARRVILNCSRQWGKSTVVAAKLTHVACTRPSSLSLIVAENLHQTAGVFQKIERFLATAGLRATRVPGFKHSLVLANHAQIIGVAAREEAVRSYTADFVFIDEGSRVPDEVIDALLPVIAVRNGDWWIASTPMGRRGRFYEMWAYETDPTTLKVSAPWTENPRLAPGYIERMRALRGDDFIRQEFECQFVEKGEYLVSHDHMKAIEA